MKFFHLSDLHIGLKLYNRDLHDDQVHIFQQICAAAKQEQPDAILIAGDIYDKALPSAEAVSLFDWFTAELAAAAPHTKLMLISGNHDSAQRINVFRQILQHQNLYMIGVPPKYPEDRIEKVTLEDTFGPVNFYLLPFVKPSNVKDIVGTDENGLNLSYNESVHRLIEREEINPSERNVLVSHQFYLPVGSDPKKIERMDNEFRTVGNIDEVKADILERFDYAALGHIHKPMKVGNERFRYCGTPMPYSVSEANQQKGILMVELGEKGTLKTTVLPLIPLHPVRVISGSLEEVLKQACDDYVSIVLTDKADPELMDMQDRIRSAFPNHLEIRRENLRMADYTMQPIEDEQMDAFTLCNAFLKDLDDEEQALLQDVINTVLEVQE